MIFGSSSSIYGNRTNTPFSENDEVNFPVSPYAASKRAAELLINTYHHLYQMDIINLRFFTVFGPRQRPDLAIYKFTDLILNDQPVTVYGEGKSARDYTFISDIVNGIMLSVSYLEKNKGVMETVNIGNSYPVQLSSLVEQLFFILEKPVTVRQLPFQAGDVEVTFADISKAGKLLGFLPAVRFNDGLKLFVDWFRNTHTR